MKENELSRMALMEMGNLGITAGINDIDNVENDAPFLAAVMSSGLVAPGMIGLNLDDTTLSKVDLDVLVRASRGMHQGDAWIRGDIMNHIRQTTYRGGDIPRPHLMEHAKHFGCHYKRLLNNMTTAAAWKIEYRYGSEMLTYSHHEALNALPQDERTIWAERAIAENITANELRTLLKDDGLAIRQVYDAEGQVTHLESEFMSEKFEPSTAVAKMWAWYDAELKKGTTPKVAFENVMHTFRKAGLVVFPARAWQAGLITHPVQSEPLLVQEKMI